MLKLLALIASYVYKTVTGPEKFDHVRTKNCIGQKERVNNFQTFCLSNKIDLHVVFQNRMFHNCYNLQVHRLFINIKPLQVKSMSKKTAWN